MITPQHHVDFTRQGAAAIQNEVDRHAPPHAAANAGGKKAAAE